MKSPAAEHDRDRLIEAILPDVPFDGWTHPALRQAAKRSGIAEDAAMALFPRGAADLVAGFSRWADRCLLDRLEAAALDGLGVSERIRLALYERFAILTPHREAVRRGLAVLAMPPNAPLGCRLLYETVDAMWYAAGDGATDFSFYTKRATLAAICAAATVYWLDDRSPEFAETLRFVDRRLDDLRRVTAVRRRLETALERLPNPFRLLRPLR